MEKMIKFFTILLFFYTSQVFSSPVEQPHENEISYFKDLLSRGMNAPIQDFLHLWYPNDVDPSVNTYFFDCLENVNQHTFSHKIMMKKNCIPEVLYSWGPKIKLENINANLKNENWKMIKANRPRFLWATMSPVSSYSYGLIPIRFKMKKHYSIDQMLSSDVSSELSAYENSLMDFIINNANAIESYSYGMPEHYDEIIKDIQQIASKKKSLQYSFNNTYLNLNGMNRVYMSGVPERGDQDEVTLKRNLLEMIRMILNNEGAVIINPSLKMNSIDLRTQHFSSERPTYFNEH